MAISGFQSRDYGLARGQLKGWMERNDFLHWAWDKSLIGTHPKYADDALLAKSKRICELYERERLVESNGKLESTHMDTVALPRGNWRRNSGRARNRAMGVEDPPNVALALAMGNSDATRAPVWDMREKLRGCSLRLAVPLVRNG